MKWHGSTLNEYCLVKGASLKKLNTLLSQWYDILKQVNLWIVARVSWEEGEFGLDEA